MKPPPPGLPSANSRKWHSRRWWDSLGYLRVRSLANPDWPRDTRWLVHALEHESQRARDGEADLFPSAVAAARRYPRTADGRDDADLAWDEVLTAIDAILVVRQARHLDDVREAGASGIN